MTDEPTSRIDQKKVVQKTSFFLPNHFHLTLILKCSVVMHAPSSIHHETPVWMLLAYIQLWTIFLIGLKIKFNVRHRNAQKILDLTMRLK